LLPCLSLGPGHDGVVLDAELLVKLGVSLRHHAQMRLLNRYMKIRIVPSFALIESPVHADLELFLVAHICELATIAQLLFQQVVIAIELALDRKVRFDARHLAQ